MDEFEPKLLQLNGEPRPEILNETDSGAVLNYGGGSARLWLRGPWHLEMTPLAHRFGVTELDASHPDRRQDKSGSIEFLDELLRLQRTGSKGGLAIDSLANSQ